MAIRRGSKVDKSYSAASMTDLMFLLLIFMLIATTLINPNALKLLLPQSANQIKEKPYTTVSITPDHQFYVETTPVAAAELESVLRSRLEGVEKPIISLHCDESTVMKDAVFVMDIAKNNNYACILATRP